MFSSFAFFDYVYDPSISLEHTTFILVIFFFIWRYFHEREHKRIIEHYKDFVDYSDNLFSEYNERLETHAKIISRLQDIMLEKAKKD